METLTRRGFLLGAGAIAIATQAMPLAAAVEWAEKELITEPELEVVYYLGRVVRVAGSGPMGDGLIVAAPGRKIPSSVLTSGNYGLTVYPGTPVREAIEHLHALLVDTVYVPDFSRRAPEIRDLSMEDPELAAVVEFARAAVRGSGRRIITL